MFNLCMLAELRNPRNSNLDQLFWDSGHRKIAKQKWILKLSSEF